jgi:signal transduction histidine kinase
MRLRRWLRSYGDPVLAAGLAAAMLTELTFKGYVPSHPEVVALAVLGTGPLAYRRRLPLASFVVLWASMLVLGQLVGGLADTSVVFLLVFFVSLYSLGAHARRAAAWVGGVLTTIGIVLFVATDGDSFQIADVLFGAVLVGGPWAAGTAIRLRRERERDLTDHAADLERQRETAVAEERRRIARELHDVVSHAISITVLHARGGRRVLDDDPVEAREAFTVIERTNAQALGDMRRLLGLLRESTVDASYEPPPSVAMLEPLVAQLRESGLDVSLAVSGDPAAIPPGIGLSAYRIVQEALTNVLRHAAGARADVAITCGERDLEVTIVDDGTGAPASPGTGHGLIGMGERVSVAGGHLETGSVDGGGFRVRALLPYEVAA